MANKFKSAGKKIKIDNAIGNILTHDITEIRPGQFKGAAFKRGHRITEEDLEHLRRLGKEHLFVLEIGQDEIHEDDAALRLATSLSGEGIIFDKKPSEGKIALRAAFPGLLKVDIKFLKDFNLVPEISCATRHNNSTVGEGEIVGATRVIPLIIDEKLLQEAESIASAANGILSLKKFMSPDTGLIVTGSEVYYGRKEDKFASIIKEKLDAFDCTLKETIYLPDDKDQIAHYIKLFHEKGYGLLILTGGMSVDPDDVTRMAIWEAGAQDIVYGTPIQPGSMFLYARMGDVPVLGLPACVLFYRATVFDIFFPRVLAGEKITREDLASMAHGGLCLSCKNCHYPVCPFGK